MTVIMCQMEEMEQKETTVQVGPCSTQLEGSVENVREKVGEKRRFRETCERGQTQAGYLRRQSQRGDCGEQKVSLVLGTKRGPKVEV